MFVMSRVSSCVCVCVRAIWLYAFMYVNICLCSLASMVVHVLVMSGVCSCLCVRQANRYQNDIRSSRLIVTLLICTSS